MENIDELLKGEIKEFNMVRGKVSKIEIETPTILNNRIKQIKNERIRILQSASKNEKIQAMLFNKCKNDVVFFFNYFLWTYDPRNIITSVPFVLYNFQEIFLYEVLESLEKSNRLNPIDTFVEKSRDMGFSWLMLGFLLWRFLFYQNDCLLGSYKEDVVDKPGVMSSLFEKIRYMIGQLPNWMVYEDLEVPFKRISSKKNNCSIIGEIGVNFGTGGRQKITFMDEFALWQDDEMAFRKIKDVCDCRIIGGTPEGKSNVYGKVMTNQPLYKKLNIKKIKLHWTLHPLKTFEWYEKMKETRTPVEIAKELDISYEDSVSGAVYPDFTRIPTMGKYDYNPDLPLYTAWDFGLDTNAIIFYQKDNKTGFLYVVDTVQKKDWNIKKMFAYILGTPTPGFVYTTEELEQISSHLGWRYSGHYGDPYNSDNRSTVTEDTIRSTLASVGIHLITNRRSTVKERIRKVTLSLDRLFINEKCVDFNNAMIQSRYPQRKEGSQETTEKVKPIHDENSHYRTAFEYGIDNEVINHKGVAYNTVGAISKLKEEKFTKRRKRYNPLTGEMV